jgi:hypothetical protein
MIPSFLIIDDFYPDPHEVREIALMAEYHLPKHSESHKGTGPWPGCVSKDRHIPKGIDSTISKVLGKPFLSDKLVGGYFRISKANDVVDQFCHTDSEPILTNKKQYQGIVYLNDVESKAGTSFYIHKRTRSNRIERFQNYASVQNDFNNPNAWELDFTISLKWNRMILFDASLFHSYGELFGTDLSTARCTHNFVFHEL